MKKNMKKLILDNNTYATKRRELPILARNLPSLYFYTGFIREVFRAARLARQGRYDDGQWGESSLEMLELLEKVGVDVHISGLEHLRGSESGPCVIIGNHMSFLETILLPGIILPKPLTFVVKQSLLEYPVFKHVMRASNPVSVSRANPRLDLKTVLEEGGKRLQAGISVVVFPQSTRSHSFDPGAMGSIGVKLAKKAGVPIVPMALKTNALQNGKIFKDFGAIRREFPVHIAFAPPCRIRDKGNEEMDVVRRFIADCLQEWERKEG